MKITTWNCNGAFRNKLDKIKELDSDIYIIQECESPDKAKGLYSEWLPNMIWKGTNQNKGIAVFAKADFKLAELDWADNNLELFLPVTINNEFQLLAVWTKYANSPTFQYIGQLWKYLQLHHAKFHGYPSIVCGDFNSNACWDVWDRWWNHTDVVNELERLNLVSMYHKIYQELQGKETNPTFFMNRNINKPYHIDYIFLEKNRIDLDKAVMSIGNQSDWLAYSDHLPVTLEFRKNPTFLL